MINVEVAYALPDEQKIVALKVEPDCTVHEAVIRSKIVEYFPQIDPDNDPMGIFGKAILLLLQIMLMMDLRSC